MIILLLISIFSFSLFVIMLLIDFIFENKNHLKLIPYNHNNYFSIVIPARYESNVLEPLLKSIENQTLKVNSKDVYIILEKDDIKSIEIVNKHNMSLIFRKNNKEQRKGFALNDAFQSIYLKNYDAYFIFDADNILDKNYLKSMSIKLSEGYDICTGYRSSKNPNSSVVSASSSLTFSLINTLNNRSRTKHHKTITISGTGFYIKGTIISKLKGYPFNSLTENYELSLYATLVGLTTCYNEDAIFYDEQPSKYNESIRQRTRWVKGYFDARKIYIPKIKHKILDHPLNINSILTEVIGVKPYIYLIISIILYLIYNILTFSTFNYFFIIITLLLIYLILVIITTIMLIKEHGRLNINKIMIIKVLLFNPIFLLSYIRCALIALFSPNLEWKTINHVTNNIE